MTDDARTAFAQALARLAFCRHLEEHQCDKRGGFGYCPTAMALFAHLSDEERVLTG